MLSDIEKIQILEQETYRREVARQLDAKQPKSTRKTVWEMLNSAIVLWLLSTVVVGLISLVIPNGTSREPPTGSKPSRQQPRSATTV